MTHLNLKKKEIAELKEKFLSVDRDDDCKISIKEMCKLLEKDYNELITTSQASNKCFMQSIGDIRIDFATFLEFYGKHHLTKSLEKIQAEFDTGNPRWVVSKGYD